MVSESTLKYSTSTPVTASPERARATAAIATAAAKMREQIDNGDREQTEQSR